MEAGSEKTVEGEKKGGENGEEGRKEREEEEAQGCGQERVKRVTWH